MNLIFRKHLKIGHQPQPGRGSEVSRGLPQSRPSYPSSQSVSSGDSDIAPDSEISYTSSSSLNESFITSPSHLGECSFNTLPFGRSPLRASSLRAITNCCLFNFAEMEAATNNFDPSLVIGKGGFGVVYKGQLVLDAQEVPVAIKRWNSLSKQGEKEFWSEIRKLLSLRHRNVVSLIGYCDKNEEMILVYEYTSKGTLRRHIRRGSKSSLPWKDRLRICIEAANGLQYLHNGTEKTIIHRDIKSTNILIDENNMAKVADLGLARHGPNYDQSHVSTAVQGTWGYTDPDYIQSGHLTEKSDVYSFGVVLLEVLTGLPPMHELLSSYEQPLSLVRRRYKKGTLDKIIDPDLKREIEIRCLNEFSKTMMDCIAEDRTQRPSMVTVVHNLVSALQTQEKAQVQSKSILSSIPGRFERF